MHQIKKPRNPENVLNNPFFYVFSLCFRFPTMISVKNIFLKIFEVKM